MSATTEPAEVFPGQPADEAIARLFELYGDKLFRLGCYQCGNDDEAEDLVQEVFTTAFRKWDQFEWRSEPSSWLYTIAVRVCRRRHRRRAGEPATIASLEDLLPGHAESMAVLPEPGDALAETIRHEANEAVDGAIARLPVHYRIPLLLKEIAELSIEEVSAILGLKEATVKTRVHRARLILRKDLAECLPHEDLPTPNHPRDLCMDLLRAKQEALDNDAEFPVPAEELCARCKALFDSLDLTRQVCLELREHAGVPIDLKELLRSEISSQTSSRPT
jgi:RNA polymerase sigma-70 factor (ECF subfamily)